MPLIDFNGKLFGKINIVDLLVILILIFGLIFAVRLVYNLAKNPNERWVIVDFRFEKIPNEVANSIKPGYVEKIADKVVAEVLDVKYLPSQDILIKPLLLKVKLLVKVENNALVHNDRNVVVGASRPLTLSPPDSDYGYVYIDGSILNIDTGLQEKKEQKIVEMKFYNQDLWVSNAIKIGSKEINYQNETVVEVLSKEVKPTEFIHVIDETGEVLVRKNPIREDITLKLKFYGKIEENGAFIFKYDKALIGKWLNLELDKSLFLTGVITKIE